MRVLLITSAYPANSADPRGTFIEDLVVALRGEGMQVTVLAPGAASAASKESRDGLEVQRVRYWIPRFQALATGLGGIVPNLRRKPWLLFQVPPLIAALTWRALRIGSAFDVIHAHWVYPAGIAGVIAARRHNVPLVITSHGGDLNLSHRSKVVRLVTCWVSRAADVCVGVSHAMADEFLALGVAPERVKFIPLGVHTPPESVADREEISAEYRRYVDFEGFRLVYVGSLIPRKSVETLLEAHRELEQRGHDVACILVGAGPSEDRLRAIVRRNSLRNVFFAGSQPPTSVPRWISAGHALVLPSLSEGRGLVVVEAMALGVPVVATDIPGPRELVQPGKTGMLFSPKDAKGLADCVEKLIQDDRFRQDMGRRGREMVEAEGLTPQHSARKHVDLYKDACAIHGSLIQKSTS